MNQPLDGAAPADDMFRLKTCPACDYSLAGLPPEGICPECGRRYDQSFIILSGNGRGKFSGMAGGNWRGDVWSAIWFVLLIWAFTSGSRLFTDPSVLLWGIVAAVGLVLSIYARVFSPRAIQAQAWIAQEGIAQVASTPEARRTNHIAKDAMWLIFPICMIALPLLNGNHRVGVIWLSILLVVVIASVWWWWLIRRRYREDGADFVPKFWPWRDVLSVEVTALPHDRTRLKCKVSHYWKRIHINNESAVDLEIRIGEADAERLRRYIQDRINAALLKGKKAWQPNP